MSRQVYARLRSAGDRRLAAAVLGEDSSFQERIRERWNAVSLIWCRTPSSRAVRSISLKHAFLPVSKIGSSADLNGPLPASLSGGQYNCSCVQLKPFGGSAHSVVRHRMSQWHAGRTAKPFVDCGIVGKSGFLCRR